KKFLALVTVGLWAGCNGTETDNPIETDSGPLVHFEGSGCKTAMPEDPGQQPLLVSSDADGLQCFSWERGDDDSLVIRLLNFDSGCGVTWEEGEATLADDGALELVALNPSCLIAACGSCLYDLDFELTGVSWSEPLPVRVALKTCPKDETEFDAEVVLPIDDTASGNLCRPIPGGPLFWYAMKAGRAGEVNMPCNTDGMAGEPLCEEGTTCVELGTDDTRCLETCSADADCTSSLMTCQDGACRSATSF
ncbi:MAG TPA: hypothetical protein VM686_30580, partial [Polyangiaceae bacterium]|nr:hypothetical protein [Polyangiaceae bacterium]